MRFKKGILLSSIQTSLAREKPYARTLRRYLPRARLLAGTRCLADVPGADEVELLEISRELVLYILRWQASSLILAPVIAYGTRHQWPPWLSAVIANLIGALVFFPFDKFVTFR